MLTDFNAYCLLDDNSLSDCFDQKNSFISNNCVFLRKSEEYKQLKLSTNIICSLCGNLYTIVYNEECLVNANHFVENCELLTKELNFLNGKEIIPKNTIFKLKNHKLNNFLETCLWLDSNDAKKFSKEIFINNMEKLFVEDFFVFCTTKFMTFLKDSELLPDCNDTVFFTFNFNINDKKFQSAIYKIKNQKVCLFFSFYATNDTDYKVFENHVANCNIENNREIIECVISDKNIITTKKSSFKTIRQDSSTNETNNSLLNTLLSRFSDMRSKSDLTIEIEELVRSDLEQTDEVSCCSLNVLENQSSLLMFDSNITDAVDETFLNDSSDSNFLHDEIIDTPSAFNAHQLKRSKFSTPLNPHDKIHETSQQNNISKCNETSSSSEEIFEEPKIKRKLFEDKND